MIRLRRVALPPDTVARLGEYTDDIRQHPTESDRRARAKNLWASSTARRRVRPALVAGLAEMAPGHERCMYCGDSQGTDIDHFEPKSLTPLRTFDWFNHLLACSYCNSNQKRNLYPTAPDRPRPPPTAPRSSSTRRPRIPWTTSAWCSRSGRTRG